MVRAAECRCVSGVGGRAVACLRPPRCLRVLRALLPGLNFFSQAAPDGSFVSARGVTPVGVYPGVDVLALDSAFASAPP